MNPDERAEHIRERSRAAVAHIGPGYDAVAQADIEWLLAERERLAKEAATAWRYADGDRQRRREEAERAALEHAPSVTALCLTWQGWGPQAQFAGVRPLPETFDQQEAVAAIVAQLNREGVPAWNGDATHCVGHMLRAQFDRWAKLRTAWSECPRCGLER